MQNDTNLPMLKILKKTIEENTVFELFVGEYNRTYSEHASVPTDPQLLFRCWITLVNKSSNKTELWELFRNTILRISFDEEYCWFSIYYLSNFLEYNKKNKVTEVEVQLLITNVIDNVKKFKKELSENYKWRGNKEDSYSLWDDFKRMIINLSEDFQYDFDI